MKDGSFPIASRKDLENAIQAYGRASDKDAAKKHIIKRARALGLTSLLPDDWNVTNNRRLVTEVQLPERTAQALRRGLTANLEAMGAVLLDNDVSFSDVSCQVTDLLASRLGEPGKYWPGYVSDVFYDPKYVVYYDGGQTYKVGYSVDDKGTASLSGDPVLVERQVVYSPVDNEAGDHTDEETEMAFDKKKHVNSLIGNGWEEADRAVLEALPDAQLEKVKPVTFTTPPPPAPTANTAPPPQGAAGVTLDQYIRNAPSQLQGPLRDMIERDRQEQEALIKVIKANPRNTIPDEALAATPIANLRAIAALAAPQDAQGGGFAPFYGNGAAAFTPSRPLVDYTGAAGLFPTANSGALPNQPTTVGAPIYDEGVDVPAAFKR